MHSVPPYFDVLSYLREDFLELLKLSRSIRFSLYPFACYSCIPLRVHSIRTSFISPVLNKSVAINKDLTQPLT